MLFQNSMTFLQNIKDILGSVSAFFIYFWLITMEVNIYPNCPVTGLWHEIVERYSEFFSSWLAAN